MTQPAPPPTTPPPSSDPTTLACEANLRVDAASDGGARLVATFRNAGPSALFVLKSERMPYVIVEAPDRTEKDRETDARRHPVQFLEFLGVKSGDRVADLGAGGGYTTELLVRAVGPTGTVYAQNNKLTIEKFVKEPWAERLKRDVNKNVVRLDREYEDPLPPEAKDLDLVTLMFSYHDVIAQNGDRTKLNRAVFQALKPGGSYVIADHVAADGSGLAAASSVHRIEEKIVRQEVEAAGFTFVESADFLKDPADDLSKPSFNVGLNTSRCLLKCKKP